jgi:Domain of unknown function (DUF5666)
VTRREIIPTEELLSTSPFEDDLAERLAAAPRRRRMPVATVVLGAGVLLVAGFAAGVRADRQWGASSRESAPSLGQFAARGGGQGFQGLGQRAADANATTGTVRLVDGDTVYVQTTSGIVRVRTNASTKVTVAKKATAKDLRTGSRVVVHGTPAQDGTVTATSVDPGQ